LCTIAEVRHGHHVARFASYRFHDSSILPYVELHETHDNAYPGRVMSLSEIVHLAQNVGPMESHAIGNREGPPAEEGPTTVPPKR
jgi:hypothetical protein